MKDKIFTETFQQIADYSTKELFVRTFGKVILDDDREINLLVIAEIYDLKESGAIHEEELPDQNKPVMLSMSLLPEIEHVHQKHKDSAMDSNGGYCDLQDIYDYMGGLRFEPNDQAWFTSMDEAREYIMSKELNDQISGMGMMSGFTMDMHYNRIGETNWDILNKIIEGK